jgi:hypothetical protein
MHGRSALAKTSETRGRELSKERWTKKQASEGGNKDLDSS